MKCMLGVHAQSYFYIIPIPTCNVPVAVQFVSAMEFTSYCIRLLCKMLAPCHVDLRPLSIIASKEDTNLNEQVLWIAGYVQILLQI